MKIRRWIWLLPALLSCVPLRAAADNGVVFPADAGVVDVTKPPFDARGDGRTDATDALQKALDRHAGTGTILYLPNGVYVVSRPLIVPLKNPQNNTNYGNTHLQGQSRDGVVIRLKDGTLTDPAHPAAVIDHGPHGSADWFHNSVRNLTIDTGRGNAGAIGLRFFSNNTGVVRDVTIRSGDGDTGVIGLDLGYNDMNGPLLVQRVTVRGFATGIQTGGSVNSQTFSQIRLENQTRVGLRNDGQCLSIEGLNSVGAVPALENRNGLIALVGARLTGTGSASRSAAIRNDADLTARDVRASGFRTAIEHAKPVPPAVQLFPSSSSSSPRPLALPIRQTPTLPDDDPATWASPLRFGGKPNQNADAAPAIQAAIDSGATTVYLPSGNWRVGRTIVLRKNVRRLIGIECHLEPIAPLDTQRAPLFRVENGAGPVVALERMSTNFASGPFCFVEQASARALVLRDIAVNFQGRTDSFRAAETGGTGPVFIENMVGGPFLFRRQSVWARQLNQESEGLHIGNDGGSLWILGLKTERGGTLVETKSGGRTEIVGGLCYTTTAGKLAPMFVSSDASVSITLGERCYTGDPYTTIVRETRKGVTRTLPASDPRYRGRLPLYIGL